MPSLFSAEDHDRLIATYEIVKEMKHTLFGNGQPGEISKIKNRIAMLEKLAWISSGGAAIIGFLISHFVR